METVLVTGEQPGPGLWKVSRGGHAVLSNAAADPALVREDCLAAAFDAAMKQADGQLPAELVRGLGIFEQQEKLYEIAGQEAYLNWMSAAEAALASNTSTFAVLPVGTALNSKNGWLGKLAEKGYLVEGPRGTALPQ
jgi:hypothetical protein